VRRTAPDNGLALYGLALDRLAHRDLDEAEALLKSAASDGELGVCMLASLYIGCLRGARPEGASVLPSYLEPARAGLEAVAAEARGDWAAALERASGVIASPATGRYDEPPTVLMTFDRPAPLIAGHPALPRGLLKVKAPPRREPVSGTIVLRGDADGAAYLAFRADGKLLSVVNSRPYEYHWDTTTVPNGPHQIEVIACDARGQELQTSPREVVTCNPGAPVAFAERELEASLWRLLALRPSRATMALLAARAAERTGDAVGRSRWANLAVAINPDARGVAERRAGPASGDGLQAAWCGPEDRKLVALTFDGGPRPGITEQLLDILTRERLPATFFLVGRYAAMCPALVAKLANSGMELANHSFTHPNLTRLTSDQVRTELMRTSACLQDAGGAAPRWFRPPGGNLSDTVSRVGFSLGMRACMWTVNAEQQELAGGDAVAAHVVSRVRPGAIVLLHNGRLPTIIALPRLIAELRSRGYTFVTVSELMERARPAQARTVLQ
jgi:peptidoglycan/xylan/chitin deacetylase (PgdA/CDA1 family)